MSAPNMQQRREIFTALRRIKGHILKIQDDADLMMEETRKANKGTFQTQCLIDMMKATAEILRFKIDEETARPGYKRLWAELKD